jgi:hypothetical protein
VTGTPNLVGAIVGGYQLEDRVASDETGDVYRGHDPARGYATVKVLHQVLDANAADRLLRGAALTAAVEDPHVVTVRAVVDAPQNRTALVMEDLDARTLTDEISVGGLSTEQILRIADQLSEALMAVHATGVVHGVLGPSSVVLVVRNGDAHFARMLAVGGPEAGQDLDPRVDVRALGSMLYLMLAGVTPSGQAPPPPSEFVGAERSPAWLDALVLDMIAPDPARRPADPHAVRRRLSEGRGLSPVSGEIVGPAPTPSLPPVAAPGPVPPLAPLLAGPVATPPSAAPAEPPLPAAAAAAPPFPSVPPASPEATGGAVPEEAWQTEPRWPPVPPPPAMDGDVVERVRPPPAVVLHEPEVEERLPVNRVPRGWLAGTAVLVAALAALYFVVDRGEKSTSVAGPTRISPDATVSATPLAPPAAARAATAPIDAPLASLPPDGPAVAVAPTDGAAAVARAPAPPEAPPPSVVEEEEKSSRSRGREERGSRAREPERRSREAAASKSAPVAMAPSPPAAAPASPKTGEDWLRQGHLHRGAGRLDLAEQAYFRASTSGDKRAMAEGTLGLADVALRKRRYSDAATKARRALSLGAERRQALDIVGQAKCALGDRAAAEAAYDEASAAGGSKRQCLDRP